MAMCNVAVVSVAADATLKDNVRRAGAVARDGAADDVNGDLGEKRKRKKRK